MSRSQKQTKKRRKIRNQTYPRECIAVLNPDNQILDNEVCGIVEFRQQPKNIVIKYKITGLTDGEHGFHIHRCGDLTKGCSSGCEHFNPDGFTHGGLNDIKSHAGD